MRQQMAVGIGCRSGASLRRARHDAPPMYPARHGRLKPFPEY